MATGIVQHMLIVRGEAGEQPHPLCIFLGASKRVESGLLLVLDSSLSHSTDVSSMSF